MLQQGESYPEGLVGRVAAIIPALLYRHQSVKAVNEQILCCCQETKLSLGHSSTVECVSFLSTLGMRSINGLAFLLILIGDHCTISGLTGFIC